MKTEKRIYEIEKGLGGGFEGRLQAVIMYMNEEWEKEQTCQHENWKQMQGIRICAKCAMTWSDYASGIHNKTN